MNIVVAVLLLAASPQAVLQDLRAEVAGAEEKYHLRARSFRGCAEEETMFGTGLAAEPTPLDVRDFRVEPVAGTEPVLLPDGTPTPLALRRSAISGRGDFYAVWRLLLRLTYGSLVRTIDFDTLHVRPVEGGTVAFEGQIVEGCRESEPARPVQKSLRRLDAVETEIAWYRERLRNLSAANGAMDRLADEMHPERMLRAVATAAGEWEELPLMLTETRVSRRELTLRGVVLGSQFEAAIEPALRKVGFDRTRIEFAPLGECRAFTATATLTGTAEIDGQAVPGNLYDERTRALCGATPSPAPKAVTARGSGPITLHGRNLELTTVFMLLNELSPSDGFIVEGDVGGRVDIDFEQVSVAEALEAMKATGIAWTGPAELRRVCRTKCKPAAIDQSTYTGERVSLILAEANVLDVFRIFGEITSLDFRARELPGTISVYAREVPWDRIFDGVVAAIGRKYAIEGTQVSLDRDGVPLDKLSSGPWRRPLRQAPPVMIAASDLRLAAWTPERAWARMPGSSKIVLEVKPDMPLHDGRVESVRGGKVTLAAADGRRITLQP